MDKNKQTGVVVQKPMGADVIVQNAPINVDPKEVMDKALEAAKVLDEVVSKSSNKSIIVVNGQKYLMFPAWQTLARFNNLAAETDWTKRIEKDGKFVGYDAKAVLINLATGQTFPGAEASCLVSESKWVGKPEFTLKSMAQTRACSKTLSNMLRWIATLAGYQGTPGEEMEDAEVAPPSNQGASQPSTAYSEKTATPKQVEFIKKNFGWKHLDLEQFVEAYKPIEELTMNDAKKMLDLLLDKSKTPTLYDVFDLFGLSEGQLSPPDEFSGNVPV